MALATGTLLAACGSGGDDTRAAQPTRTATATPEESAAETPAPTATASRGARLRSIGRFSSPVYVTSPPAVTWSPMSRNGVPSRRPSRITSTRPPCSTTNWRARSPGGDVT